MLSGKEKFLSVMRGEMPLKWMGYAFEPFPKTPFHAVIDPITIWDILFIQGEYVVDNWGVAHRFIPGEDPGIIPIVTEENQVIKDMAKWRDYVTFPQIPDDLDWSAAKEAAAAAREADEFVMCATFRGLFERLHCLRTFENTLVDMYIDPDSCYDFFGAYTDWKLQVAERLCDEIGPDIIHSHDDWGSKQQPFFSPDKFEELLFPHYKRLYDYYKKRGVIVQHHCDSFIQGFENYLVGIGADMWQGALPENDLIAMRENTKGKLLYLGGLDQGVIDRPQDEVTEEEIRAHVRAAIDKYAPGGLWLPCIGGIECINTWVTPIVIDECNRYGAEWLAGQQ
ncbi:MAG: methyltransferase [Clostridiales Family XIII bacterium]|jgi:hypothetical protein|nr:methyltransferase [Clostridiales Family XIII bacterium]